MIAPASGRFAAEGLFDRLAACVVERQPRICIGVRESLELFRCRCAIGRSPPSSRPQLKKLARSVTVAHLVLVQIVQVQILAGQLGSSVAGCHSFFHS